MQRSWLGTTSAKMGEVQALPAQLGGGVAGARARGGGAGGEGEGASVRQGAGRQRGVVRPPGRAAALCHCPHTSIRPPDDEAPQGKGRPVQRHHAAAGPQRQQLRARRVGGRAGGRAGGSPGCCAASSAAGSCPQAALLPRAASRSSPSPALPPGQYRHLCSSLRVRPPTLNMATDSGTPSPTDTCATATRPWLGYRAAAQSPMKPPSWRWLWRQGGGC